MRDIAILLMLIAMLPAGMRATNVGAMMWAWVALVSPNEYAYGIASTIPYNKIAVGVTFLSLIFGKTKNRFYIDTNFVVLTAFLLVCMIAFANGLSDLNRPYDLADRMLKIYLLCVVMMACLQTRLQIHGMVLAICLGVGIHGVLEGLKYLASGGGHIVLGPRNLGDNNQFGLAILMAVPLLIYGYRYAAHILVRYALLGATVTNLVAIVATASRGALVGLIAISMGMALRSKRKGTAILIIALGGCLIVAFAPARWTQRMDTISTAEQDGSFMSRVISWKLNAVVAVERPFGVGFSGLEDRKVFEAYRYKINTTIPFFVVEEPESLLAAHSIYFEALGDNGFLGLALFVGLLAVAFGNLRAIRRMARGHDDLGWAFDLANTLWIVMIGYVVAGAALSMTYFELFYMMLILISVLRRHVSAAVGVRATMATPVRMAPIGGFAGATRRLGG
jgi:probable O-glycosylation ligase (exosortase A-associated)